MTQFIILNPNSIIHLKKTTDILEQPHVVYLPRLMLASIWMVVFHTKVATLF